MTAPNQSRSIDQDQASPEAAATIKAAAGWVQNLSRTLKTCRLYDASNPAVLRFRAQLHESLTDLVGAHGAISFRFTSDDVQLDGASLYPARSRDDNLALAFFRDGVRSITFNPGVAREELDVLLDGLLTVTGTTHREDDLVTLLWQGNLPHVRIEHIAAQGDVLGPSGADSGDVVPWPSGGDAGDETQEASSGAAADPSEVDGHRSDDWDVGELTADLEADWRAMQDCAVTELERFQAEYGREREALPVPLAIALGTAYASAEATPSDMAELARFLPRVLRIAVADGEWGAAADAIALLDRCSSPEWSPVAFAQELNQPISVAGIVQWLDQQDEAAAGRFIAFTRMLDAPGVDLLHLVMVEVQRPAHRASLMAAIVAACREQPEHLAAWLADPRESVVQNVVQMLAKIGGPSIVGLLRAVAQHPDPRVRHEVVTALRQADPEEARPVLLRMLEGADARTFCSVLHSLSDRRDPAISRRLIEFIKQAEFERRPDEEKRSVYLTLAAVAGDEAVPEIEAEMHRASWFNRGPDPHRHSLARCLARIGTPVAREALARGARSKKPVIRKACEDALEVANRNG